MIVDEDVRGKVENQQEAVPAFIQHPALRIPRFRPFEIRMDNAY